MILTIPIVKYAPYYPELGDQIKQLGANNLHRLAILFDEETAQEAGDLHNKIANLFAEAEMVPLPATRANSKIGRLNSALRYWAIRLKDLSIQEPREHFFWFEPDSNVPLEKRWLDSLQAEYLSNGKAFLGVIEPVYLQKEGEWKQDSQHVPRSSIYPVDLAKRSILINFLQQDSFDIEMQWEILGDCAKSELLQYAWGTGNYARDEKSRLVGEDRRGPEDGYPIDYAKPVRSSAVVVQGLADDSLLKLLVT